ncbi:MAG: hypothetical protein HKP58_11335 [Desulfatitalea sp.]|nr:hypothetical protein [Desulfatitalea sp.]NNK00995.1 hypothetical protein [Desulfatitalea sp.]
MIEAFFFNNDQLYGCYHPSADMGSTRLVVICPPFFEEYQRCYKALVDLSNTCAEEGVHVLRFDYFGTGDSQGLLQQASLDTWKDGVFTAIEEGLDLSGASEVMLLGVRFGATLASNINHRRIKRYVFWDPVENGVAYQKWLEKVNHRLKRRHRQIARQINQPLEKIAYEYFRLPAAMRSDMAAMTLIENAAQTFVITTDKSIYHSRRHANCDYPGLTYNWLEGGLISQKPILEALARRVLEP